MIQVTKATKIAMGTTQGQAWQSYQVPGTTLTGISITVDTNAAGFSKTPIYLTSLCGTVGIWTTTGVSSIYNATSKGFQIYIRQADGSKLTPEQAQTWGWYIQWIGIEEG